MGAAVVVAAQQEEAVSRMAGEAASIDLREASFAAGRAGVSLPRRGSGRGHPSLSGGHLRLGSGSDGAAEIPGKTVPWRA